MVERALIHYGVIYDAATMQIAFAIFPQFAAGMEIANAQTKRLLSGFAMPNTTFVEQKLTRNPGSTIRGWTNLDMPPVAIFLRQGQTRIISAPSHRGPGAYLFRSIVDQVPDRPANRQDHLQRARSEDRQGDRPAHRVGGLETDHRRKPWAAMIGPLQLAYSAYGGMPPLESDAVRLALTILPAYEAMEDPDGGLPMRLGTWPATWPGARRDVPIAVARKQFLRLCRPGDVRDVLLAAGDTTHLPLVEHLIARTEHHFATHLYCQEHCLSPVGPTIIRLRNSSAVAGYSPSRERTSSTYSRVI